MARKTSAALDRLALTSSDAGKALVKNPRSIAA
jgi:hypothetical protein